MSRYLTIHALFKITILLGRGIKVSIILYSFSFSGKCTKNFIQLIRINNNFICLLLIKIFPRIVRTTYRYLSIDIGGNTNEKVGKI